MTNYKTHNVAAVDVYAEGRKARHYVGRLTKDAITKPARYVFRYNPKYMRSVFSIPLGPELPLTKEEYQSAKLFPSFGDRLPSPENPAYHEYLEKFNLDPSEKDPFVLLTTIGRAGPSSFIFEPVPTAVPEEALKRFRTDLGLTIREFATAFDIGNMSVQKIEKGTAGREILKRVELYARFPEAALFEVRRNAAKLHEAVKENLIRKLEIRKAER